jgi:hypothetical protein
VDDRATRTVLLREEGTGALLDLLPYKINRLVIGLKNLRRTFNFAYYAGGGPEATNLLPVSMLEYLVHRYPPFRRFVIACFRIVVLPITTLLKMGKGAVDRAFAFLVIPSEDGEASKRKAVGIEPLKFLYRHLVRSLLRIRRLLQNAGAFTYRLLNPAFLIFFSRRLAHVLRDGDLRWLKVSSTARYKLAASKDPWFKAPSDEAKPATEVETTTRRIDNRSNAP